MGELARRLPHKPTGRVQRVKLGTSDLLCFSFVPLPAAFQACNAKPSSSEGKTDPQDVWSMTFLQPLTLCHECPMMGSTTFQGTPLKVPSMNLSNQGYLFIVCGQWSQKSPWFDLYSKLSCGIRLNLSSLETSQKSTFSFIFLFFLSNLSLQFKQPFQFLLLLIQTNGKPTMC